MILPPRPLRLRADYVRAARRRIATLLAIAALGTFATALTAYEVHLIGRLDQAWRDGEPVETVSLEIDDTQWGFLHSITTAIVYRDETGERATMGPSFSIPSELSEQAAGSRRVRRERATGLVVPELVVLAGPERRASALVTIAALVLCIAVLLVWAARRVLELRLTRRAAARSDEVLAERVPGGRRARVRFLLPPTRPAVASYRENARPRRPAMIHRQREDEPAPLWFGSEQTHAIALRPDPSREEVILVRDDLWPFELSRSERDAVRERIEIATRTDATTTG